MSDVTEAFIEQAWNRAHDPMAQLVTITSDALTDPIRVTDWQGGLVSQDDAFLHYPFRLAWAGASKETPYAEGRLTIANVDRRIEEACDAALESPRIDLGLVRVDATDVVERAISGARIPTIEGDSRRATAVIRPRDFDREPAMAWKYTPATVPGLF